MTTKLEGGLGPEEVANKVFFLLVVRLRQKLSKTTHLILSPLSQNILAGEIFAFNSLKKKKNYSRDFLSQFPTRLRLRGLWSISDRVGSGIWICAICLLVLASKLYYIKTNIIFFKTFFSYEK